MCWFFAGHPWIQVDGVAPDKPLDSAVLSRLKQFYAMNKLKKMALRVSYLLFYNPLSWEYLFFFSLGIDNYRLCSFYYYLQSWICQLVVARFWCSMLENFCLDCQILLNYCCSLQVIAQNLSEEEIAGLKEMFKMIDTDNSGQITFEELKVGLKKFGANLNESEIYDLMQSVSIQNHLLYSLIS